MPILCVLLTICRRFLLKTIIVCRQPMPVAQMRLLVASCNRMCLECYRSIRPINQASILFRPLTRHHGRCRHSVLHHQSELHLMKEDFRITPCLPETQFLSICKEQVHTLALRHMCGFHSVDRGNRANHA